jgi:hypothetical protein
MIWIICKLRGRDWVEVNTKWFLISGIFDGLVFFSMLLLLAWALDRK